MTRPGAWERRIAILAYDCETALAAEPPGRPTRMLLVKRARTAVSGLLPPIPHVAHHLPDATVTIAMASGSPATEIALLARVPWSQCPGTALEPINTHVNGWGVGLALEILHTTQHLNRQLTPRFARTARAVRDQLIELVARRAHELVADGRVGLDDRGGLQRALAAVAVDRWADDVGARLDRAELQRAPSLASPERELFDQVWRRHSAQLARGIQRRGVHNPHDIDDVLQILAYKVMRSMQGRMENLTGAFLHACITSAISDWWSKKPDIPTPMGTSADGEDPEGAPATTSLSENVRLALLDAVQGAGKRHPERVGLHEKVAEVLDSEEFREDEALVLARGAVKRIYGEVAGPLGMKASDVTAGLADLRESLQESRMG